MATSKTQTRQVKVAPLITKVVTQRNGVQIATKTLYSKSVHKKIVDSVKKGRSISDSGLLAGLSKDLIWTWLENGRNKPDQYPDFARLSDEIEQAKAERRAQAVDNIVTVGNSQSAGTWQANAWFLERTDPENWGRKDKVEHVNEAPKTQVNAVVLIDSDTRGTARDLLQRIAGHSSPDLAIGPGGGVQLEDGSS